MSASPEPHADPSVRRAERGRAPWVVGLGVSAALHLLALVLYSGIQIIPTVTVTPPTGRDAPLDGLQLIDVVAIQPPEEEEEEEEEEAPAVEETETPPGEAPAAEAPAVARPAEGVPSDEAVRTAIADRLRLRASDPRLWTPVDPERQLLGAEEIMELDLRVAVAAFADSLAAARERAESLTDWTWTDGEGGRWGVSPGKIHLGDITLPLPFGFGATPGNRDREMEAARRNGEIERQAITGVIVQTWEDRLRAIRERADRERARRLEPPPDTTRTRRR
jgi:hypothetical protein